MKIVILTADNHDVLHGVVNAVAPLGLGMRKDPANLENLIPATGVKAHLLQRDVVAEIPLSERIFNNQIVTPTAVGTSATARKARLIEIEGPDLIVQSGVQPILPNTAVDLAVEYFNGRLRLQSGNAEIAGHIRGQLTPEDAGNTRVLVELVP